ncbi:transposase [Streptomyces sp. NPDC020192]|uniref:transposase n=1 Tax=Streptomyces sp. NPDC020192 TaxID=3365066 RepID=UPI00379CE206
MAEQIPDLTRRHARRTKALTAQLTDIALFLGGRAGASLCGRLAVTTGKDTLLRLLRAPPVPAAESVPCLGVDEFAVRRGRTYATILVDMNTHRPADVLTDRTAHTFAAWLREHPEVRVARRDRTASFRDGAHAGAPQARQVADAWHLLHNLAEAVEREKPPNPAKQCADASDLSIAGAPWPAVAAGALGAGAARQRNGGLGHGDAARILCVGSHPRLVDASAGAPIRRTAGHRLEVGRFGPRRHVGACRSGGFGKVDDAERGLAVDEVEGGFGAGRESERFQLSGTPRRGGSGVGLDVPCVRSCGTFTWRVIP